MEAKDVFEFVCSILSKDTFLFLQKPDYYLSVTKGRVHYRGHFTLTGNFHITCFRKGFLCFKGEREDFLFYKEDFLKHLSEKDGRQTYVVHCCHVGHVKEELEPSMAPIRMAEDV